MHTLRPESAATSQFYREPKTEAARRFGYEWRAIGRRRISHHDRAVTEAVAAHHRVRRLHSETMPQQTRNSGNQPFPWSDHHAAKYGNLRFAATSKAVGPVGRWKWRTASVSNPLIGRFAITFDSTA